MKMEQKRRGGELVENAPIKQARGVGGTQNDQRVGTALRTVQEQQQGGVRYGLRSRRFIKDEPVAGTSLLNENQMDKDDGQQTAADPVEVLKVVFAERNIEDAPKMSPGAPLQSLANFIIDNTGKFPKYPAPKVNIPQDELEPTFILLDGAVGKLMDVFFEDFREHIGTHFSRQHKVVYDKEVCNRLLHQHFPYCRTPLIEYLVDEFRGRFSTAAWFCFFVESGMGFMIRQYFLHIDHDVWICLSMPNMQPRKRKLSWIPNPEEGPLADSIHEFYSTMRRFRADYDQIFDADKDRLLPNATQIVGTNPGQFERFECLVCTEDFPISRAVFCNPGSTLNAVDLVDRPGTSNQQGAGGDEDHKKHLFCVECLIGAARAATQEMPLAEGGIGLHCMAPRCENPILFSECRFFIPPNVRRQLNARIAQENLGTAKLKNLERCNQCNFAMIIEASTDQLRVFSCRKCRAEHCRQCQHPWDEYHFGKGCQEMLQANEKEKARHAYEDKLSEAIIRRCPRCSVPFVKDEGCNKMQCRCGTSQCYICRAKNINYAHFCQHFRNPGQPNACRQCKKQCLLWQSEADADAQALEMVRQEAQNAGVEGLIDK